MMTSYIAKKLSKRKVCAAYKMKMIANETSIKYDENLKTLSRRGLIFPSPPSRDLVFQSFETLDYISQIIHNIRQNVSVRSVAKEILSDLQTNCSIFTCIQHKKVG